MARMPGLTVAIAGVAFACVVAACASTGNTAGKATAPLVQGNRAAEYSSLDALAQQSQAVVIAQAGDQSASKVHGVPFVTTEMTVSQIVAGSVPDKFRLYQIGADDGSAEPGMKVATTHRSYLLFLVPFQTSPGVAVAPDLFTTVGAAAGMFEQSSSDGFAKTDPESPHLPKTVTRESAAAAFERTRS